jgi:hypothetical protein
MELGIKVGMTEWIGENSFKKLPKIYSGNRERMPKCQKY